MVLATPEFDELKDHVFELTNALIVRMREISNENDAEFILLDIATTDYKNSVHLHERFTEKDLADKVIRSTEFINAYEGDEHLYRPAGHGHWTDVAHKIAGELIGDMIIEDLTNPQIETVTDSLAVVQEEG